MKDRMVEKLMREEARRQETTITLIPSENYVSRDLLAILGSPLTNKYSEGYPGKRYYPGNALYDRIELLAIDRMRKVFGLNDDWHVNVQAYSGSPANLAICYALLQQGEPLMGMALTAGGHLTHGHRVNFSGRLYHSIPYGVDQNTGLIDYNDCERLALQHQPKLIISGATAYPRVIDFEKFGVIARKIAAYHVADISHIAGLVAAGLHPSPFPHSDVVMTTTHKTLRGPRAAVIFSRRDLADRIDRAVFPGLQGGPHNTSIAAIASMAWEAKQKSFKEYQTQIVKNARALAAALQERGFILVTGGTDNHLLLMDCKNIGLEGKQAETILESAGITANRNTIPGDTSPFYPSGLRMGTPAITTRGMKEKEMIQIAEWVRQLFIARENPTRIIKEILILCKQFPIYEKD